MNMMKRIIISSAHSDFYNEYEVLYYEKIDPWDCSGGGKQIFAVEEHILRLFSGTT